MTSFCPIWLGQPFFSGTSFLHSLAYFYSSSSADYTPREARLSGLFYPHLGLTNLFIIIIIDSSVIFGINLGLACRNIAKKSIPIAVQPTFHSYFDDFGLLQFRARRVFCHSLLFFAEIRDYSRSRSAKIQHFHFQLVQLNVAKKKKLTKLFFPFKELLWSRSVS